MGIKARASITLTRVDDGAAGNGISKTEVYYYLSTSNTEQLGGSWSTDIPAWVDGRYYWQKIRVTYTNGTASESKPACITGATGGTGTGIASVIVEFYLSISKTTQTGGSWTTSMPVWTSGKYLWTRNKITYKNPTTVSYTEPICDSSWEAANEAAKTATNFMEFKSGTGLEIGDKTGGAWKGFRTQITSSAFNILSDVGDTLASYGAHLIELGKNSIHSIIELCGNKGRIHYNGEENYLEFSSDKLRVRGNEQAALYATFHEGTMVKKSSVIVEPDNIEMFSTMSNNVEPDGSGIFETSTIQLTPQYLAGTVRLNIDIQTLDPTGYVNVNPASDRLVAGTCRFHPEWIGMYPSNKDALENTNRKGWIGHNKKTDLFIKNELGGDIVLNDMPFGKNKVLWSGGWYMTEGHVATLSEPISKQPHGVVCIFTAYVGGQMKDYDYHTFFIPKELVARKSGRSVSTIMSINSSFGWMIHKVLVPTDTKITGHNTNKDIGKSSGSGIQYYNDKAVMTYVIGV